METYDKKAAELIERSYQTPEIVNQRLRTLAALALSSGESVLDAGCGPGLLHMRVRAAVGLSRLTCSRAALKPCRSRTPVSMR